MQSLTWILDEVKTCAPELWQAGNGALLTRLKGILQLSELEAIGFSFIMEGWHREDTFIEKARDFRLDLVEVSIILDEKEDLLEIPKGKRLQSMIWTFSCSPNWSENKKDSRFYNVFPIFG
jgi:hypothetical protein